MDNVAVTRFVCAILYHGRYFGSGVKVSTDLMA